MKKEETKNLFKKYQVVIIMTLFLVLVTCMSVGFAALRTNLFATGFITVIPPDLNGTIMVNRVTYVSNRNVSSRPTPQISNNVTINFGNVVYSRAGNLVYRAEIVNNSNFDYIYNEIKLIKEAIKEHTLKVIIETCYLTEEEIKNVSLMVKKANANFVKTSTGFGIGGATVENVKLIKETVGDFDIKASGGIKTKEDFNKMIEAGATRIGTSNGKNLI